MKENKKSTAGAATPTAHIASLNVFELGFGLCFNNTSFEANNTPIFLESGWGLC
ncbi:hypothetical protein [Veillonella magna]|uniref:hypothetical protein n=1 Tax=Veillonella magna TaxID=464322 RepID=UPI0026666821|nr:hypothetical protein [Veillonella magna]